MFSYSCAYVYNTIDSSFQCIAMNVSITLRMNKFQTLACTKYRLEDQPIVTQEVL